MHPVKHFNTITVHHMRVLEGCFRVGLYWQGLTHDLSKYSVTEFWRGARYYQGTRSPNAEEREENIPCDLNDTAWFSKIDASGGAVFFASGVFYYFLTEQVRTLVQKMADAFPGGVLVFDAANRTAVKMIAKTWLKSAKIKDVGAYFAVSDAKSELSLWDSRLQVTSRGYMLGYNDLRDPSVSGFFRFLAKVGDDMMKMQIVKIGFGGKQ